MAQSVNKIIKNTVYMYGNTILTMFVSLYSTRLILNSLGVSDFGIFSIVGGAIGMLGFLNGSMSTATQRFINYAQGEGDKNGIRVIFNSSVIIHIILSLVVLAALEIAFFVYFNGVLNIPVDRINAAKWIYQFMVISAILAVLVSPYNASINAHEDMGYLSLFGIVMCIGKLIIALCISISPIDKLIFYGLGMAVIQWANLAVFYRYCKKHYPECILNIKKYADKKTIRKMFAYASYSLMGTLTSMLSVYGGNILINNFFGTLLNAAQGIASQISGQIMVFSVSLKTAINPVIGKKAGSHDFQSMLKFAFTTSKLSFYLLSFFAIVFLVETPWILKIWLKTVPDWAVVFCRLEIIKNLLFQFMEGPKSALMSEGRIRSFSIFESVLYVIPLPVIYMCFANGLSPVVYYYIMILFFNLIAGSSIIYFANKNCGMSICSFLKDVVGRGCITFALVLLSSYIPHLLMAPSFIRTVLVFVVSTLMLALTVYFVGFNVDERNLVKKLYEAVAARRRNIVKK